MLLKNKKKEILKVACLSKKAKFIDDPTVAEAATILVLRDQWLIENNKTNLELKAQIKKANKEEKKQ